MPTRPDFEDERARRDQKEWRLNRPERKERVSEETKEEISGRLPSQSKKKMCGDQDPPLNHRKGPPERIDSGERRGEEGPQT